MTKVAVFGAGGLGTALARRLAPLGHKIVFTFGRDEAALAAKANSFGVKSVAPREASAWADVIAITTPWGVAEAAISAAGAIDGKTVWDCTNPMKPDYSGLQVGLTSSAAERLQAAAANATVIKGIPPFAELLHSDEPTLSGQPAGCFVCGPDGPHKKAVIALLEDLPASPVDAGPLENARYIEPAAFLLVRIAYGMEVGPRIGLRFLRG